MIMHDMCWVVGLDILTCLFALPSDLDSLIKFEFALQIIPRR